MLAVKIQGWHFINSIKSSERLPAPNGAGSKKIYDMKRNFSKAEECSGRVRAGRIGRSMFAGSILHENRNRVGHGVYEIPAPGA